jgi:hypothetical protein
VRTLPPHWRLVTSALVRTRPVYFLLVWSLNITMDPLNLELFRGKPGYRPRQDGRKRLPRHRPQEWFLKGPIPGDWLQRAAALPGRALHVGLAVWHLAALERSDTGRLTSKQLARFGVKPDAARRGLTALERAGLVTVVRHPGRCPIVSIVKHSETDT